MWLLFWLGLVEAISCQIMWSLLFVYKSEYRQMWAGVVRLLSNLQRGGVNVVYGAF